MNIEQMNILELTEYLTLIKDRYAKMEDAKKARGYR